MASANVDFVRRAFEAQDVVGVTGAMPFLRPDAEMELVGAGDRLPKIHRRAMAGELAPSRTLVLPVA